MSILQNGTLQLRACYVVLDTIKDFLRKLGMKPHMLAEISIFSVNYIIVRPTKIIKDTRKANT